MLVVAGEYDIAARADLADGLARVQVFRACFTAVHDRVAAVQLECVIEVLEALVRHHLLLPDIASRRDLDDIGTIIAVANAVGSVGTIELLAALTEADSIATSKSAWGGWKAELVRELATRVVAYLRGEHEEDPTSNFPSVELLEQARSPGKETRRRWRLLFVLR